MSIDDPEIRAVLIDEEHAGVRLDKALAIAFDDISRARLQSLITALCVTVNGKVETLSRYKVRQGDELAVEVPPPEDATPQPQDIKLDVFFEDEHLLVINKPAGMVVHPAVGNHDGTLVNALLYHCGDSLSGIGGVRRPGIVHRLDKDTTGLMVVAKNDAAHQSLSEQFAAHGRDGILERAYRAIVWGVLGRSSGTVETRLGRSPHSRLKMAVLREGGRHAVTHWTRKQGFFDLNGAVIASEVECVLETGRTHQIRIHMGHIGHPLLGDMVYGSGFKASARNLPPKARSALAKLQRQALHAYKLGFEHPVSGEKVVFEAALPDDLKLLINSFKSK
jgi:23S rRNA pseudouridine1911/1915/1917 synthase